MIVIAAAAGYCWWLVSAAWCVLLVILLHTCSIIRQIGVLFQHVYGIHIYTYINTGLWTCYYICYSCYAFSVACSTLVRNGGVCVLRESCKMCSHAAVRILLLLRACLHVCDKTDVRSLIYRTTYIANIILYPTLICTCNTCEMLSNMYTFKYSMVERLWWNPLNFPLPSSLLPRSDAAAAACCCCYYAATFMLKGFPLLVPAGSLAHRSVYFVCTHIIHKYMRFVELVSCYSGKTIAKLNWARRGVAEDEWKRRTWRAQADSTMVLIVWRAYYELNGDA